MTDSPRFCVFLRPTVRLESVDGRGRGDSDRTLATPRREVLPKGPEEKRGWRDTS